LFTTWKEDVILEGNLARPVAVDMEGKVVSLEEVVVEVGVRAEDMEWEVIHSEREAAHMARKMI
jgi:hypothetical protein